MMMRRANHLRWQRPLSLLLLIGLGAVFCEDVEPKEEDPQGDEIENSHLQDPAVGLGKKIMSCYEEIHWHLNGMRSSAITVKFLGAHESQGPGERALRAFWRLAKSGLWTSKLSADYRVVSMGQVYNDSTLVGHALEKVFKDSIEYTPIISMGAWEEEQGLMILREPVDYIVVRDGGKRCKSHSECLTSLASEVRKATNDKCSMADNFYIGGDGEAYEGRGWRSTPYWHLNGMRSSAITVKFLGAHESQGPSERALRAFWRLAKSGLWTSKLSADYRVVSMGRVYNDSTLVGHALEKVFKDSIVENKEFNMMATWELAPDKSLPLITREEWGAKEPTKPSSEMEFWIKYIIINEGGERCFTHEECTSRMKAEQERQLRAYGDLADNFYIGEDGYVYEGRGLNVKPLWDTEIEVKDTKIFKDDFMTVTFFGHFQSDLPSEKAIGALTLLVDAGIWLNRITNNYKIYSLRGFYNDPRFLGDKLFETAKKWTPWANELDESIAKKIKEGDAFMGLVKRNYWGGKAPTKTLGKLNYPVDFVVVDSNSEYDTCLSSKKCAKMMKEIQESELEGYGDLKYNFYVSDNGNIYEGRGWNTEPYFQPKYFNKSLITVNFLGNHKTDGVSLLALAALDNLIRVGVKFEIISPIYQFYSSRNLYDDADLLGDGLKSYFEKKVHWPKNLDTLTEKERFDTGLLPVIPHDDWSDIKVSAVHHAFSDPVHYVIVSSMRERCYSHEECADIMTEVHGNEKAKKEGLLDNFYVGDDGLAYEGRGWSFAPNLYREGHNSEFYLVVFLGQYREGNQPSKDSIRAFNRLMENGVKMNKLAPDFKIISINQILGIGSTDNLYSTIKTWHRWTSEFNLLPAVDGMPSGHNIFITRKEWQAGDPVRSTPITQRPRSHVVVRRAGDDCGDMTSCMESLRKIKNNLHPRYWDVPDNFYVGGDGHIYEGIGGDHSPLWATKGIDKDFISVGFLGSFENTPPTQKAMTAFHILLRVGLSVGMVAPGVKTISFGEIVGKDKVTEKLIEALNTTDGWSDTFELDYDAFRLRSIDTSLVLSDEWNLSDLPVRRSIKMSHPLKYVAIRDGGASCDTFKTCVARIKKEHETADQGVAESFYIGNDGSVFEGTGWDWDMQWAYPGWQKTAEVQFFGNYENDLPSQKAIDAFNEIIIKLGIETGKLSSDYHVVPTPLKSSRALGSKLKKEIKTWKNAIEEIPSE